MDAQKGKTKNAPPKQWTPPDGTFLLLNPEPLKSARLNKGEWLGIYQGPGPGGELLYTSRSPLSLYRKLKCRKKRIAVCWPVSARRAPSRGELSVRIGADKPDHFMVQRQQAYAAVGRAWNIVRNSIELYSEADVKRARDFLRELGKACRSEGKSRGDKTQAIENQKMLRVFWLLLQGKSLKEIAIEEKGSERYEREMRSLFVQTKRFERRVNAVICRRCGKVPVSIRQKDAHEKCWGYFSSLFGSIEKWPGVKSNCREHGYALCEALRRHTPAKTDAAKAKHRAFGVTSYPVQIGPKSSP
jgi:hypothetical protein